jgi:hypothetical protein
MPWRCMGEWMYRSTFSWPSCRWVVSFTPLLLYPSTHRIGSWVGPRIDLDDVKKRKFLPLPGLELRTLRLPARSQSLYWLCNMLHVLFSCKILKKSIMLCLFHNSKTLLRFPKNFEDGWVDTVERGRPLMLYVKPISIIHAQESSRRIYSINSVGLGILDSSV